MPIAPAGPGKDSGAIEIQHTTAMMIEECGFLGRTMDDVRLIQGDCLAVMGAIPDRSIDLVCADLPYQMTRCAWDEAIPLGPLWDHYRRLLKPRGAVVLTASQPFTSILVMSNLEWFRYEWMWNKRTASGFRDARRKPMKAHESILVFGPHLPRYHPQMTGFRKAEVRRMRKHDFQQGTTTSVYQPGSFVSRGWFAGRRKFPKSVININGLTPTSAEKQSGRHSTQKPVALMEYLIRTYSNEGDTVLDNAMGSGTTLVACLNTGRRGIGIEKDPAIFAVAQDRLALARLLRERPHAPLPRRNHAERPMPLFDGLDTGDVP